jgi:DTW domain-containing protein YfiP
MRRSRGQGQLSTFEAALQALALLEGDAAGGLASRFDPLWAVFDAFVAQLAQRAPPPAAPAAI